MLEYDSKLRPFLLISYLFCNFIVSILTKVLEESMQCLSLIHGINYFWSNKKFFNREKFYKVSVVMKLPISIIRQFPAYNLSISNLPVTSKYSGSIKRRYISIFLRTYDEDGKRILRRRTSIFSMCMENGLAFVQFILSIYIPWRVVHRDGADTRDYRFDFDSAFPWSNYHSSSSSPIFCPVVNFLHVCYARNSLRHVLIWLSRKESGERCFINRAKTIKPWDAIRAGNFAILEARLRSALRSYPRGGSRGSRAALSRRFTVDISAVAFLEHLDRTKVVRFVPIYFPVSIQSSYPSGQNVESFLSWIQFLD